MPADVGRREIHHRLHAVLLDHAVDAPADLVGDLVEIPDVVVVELAALVGVADVLVRQRHARVLRRDVAEHGADRRHYFLSTSKNVRQNAGKWLVLIALTAALTPAALSAVLPSAIAASSAPFAAASLMKRCMRGSSATPENRS